MNCLSLWQESKSKSIYSLVNVFLNHPTFQTAPQALLQNVTLLIFVSYKSLIFLQFTLETAIKQLRKFLFFPKNSQYKAELLKSLCSFLWLSMKFCKEVMKLALLSFIFLFSVPCFGRYYTTPKVPLLTDLVPHVSIDECFAEIFGASNIQLRNNGSSVNLILDKVSGKSSMDFIGYHGIFVFLSWVFLCLFLEVLVWYPRTDISMDSLVLQLSFQQVSLQGL